MREESIPCDLLTKHSTHINSSLLLHLMAASYSCKHLLLCVIVLLAMVFMAGMVNAVNEVSALRGAIQKAMTEVGCKGGGFCGSDADCGGGYCVSCDLLFRNHSKIN
jgi:hypothetical protein